MSTFLQWLKLCIRQRVSPDPNPVVAESETFYARRDGSIYFRDGNKLVDLEPRAIALLREIAGQS
jgi:hypothetical protein